MWYLSNRADTALRALLRDRSGSAIVVRGTNRLTGTACGRLVSTVVAAAIDGVYTSGGLSAYPGEIDSVRRERPGIKMSKRKNRYSGKESDTYLVGCKRTYCLLCSLTMYEPCRRGATWGTIPRLLDQPFTPSPTRRRSCQIALFRKTR
jgi:hypothetical protein